MVKRLRGVVLDNTSGADVQQDIKLYMGRYSLPQTAQGRFTPGDWHFNIGATDSYNFREQQEWWCAVWDDALGDAGEFDLGHTAYGGYIGLQSGGNPDGGEYQGFHHSLDTYTPLLSGAYVQAWPPQNPVIEDVLMPPGFSVADYLVGVEGETGAGGIIPCTGVLRERFAGSEIDWSGIDSDVGGVIFTEAGRPGNPDGVPGRWTFTKPDAVCVDIITKIRQIQPEYDPVAYFEATVSPTDPTKIIPRFRLKNLAATGGSSVATFVLASDPSVNPAGGIWPIMEPFEHGRNARGAAKQLILVWGPGTEVVDGVEQHIYAYAYDSGRPVNRTKYQTDPGWAGDVVFDERIDSIAKAEEVARAIEARSWGALGTVRFTTARETIPGEIITVDVPPQGFVMQAFVVNQVRAHTDRGYPLYELSIGDPEIRLADILNGALGSVPRRRI